MVFVKKVRSITWEGNQRMQAISMKRSRKLIRNKSTRVLKEVSVLDDECG